MQRQIKALQVDSDSIDRPKELADMEKRLDAELRATRKRLGKGEPMQPIPTRGAIELFLLDGRKPEVQRW